MPQHVIIDDSFAHLEKGGVVAKAARQLFDDTHARPDRASTERAFRWEYWNAGGGQYAHLRSPAASFFGPPVVGEASTVEMGKEGLFPELVELITSFGQRQLGMNSITPPWLSCYVEGHEQRLHTDPAHGPWAYVLSLTLDEAVAAMGGGETQILKPEILDFWRGFDGFAKEQDDIFEVVPPNFGRFLAFDPRFPHGVRAVHGPRGMATGRLVIHGWFSDPEPFFVGGLTAGAATAPTAAGAALDVALAEALDSLTKVGRVTGCLSVRLTVSGATGRVSAVDALCDSLVPDPEDFQGSIGETELGETIYEDARADVLLALNDALSAAQFPVATSGEDTEITVPFIFE